MFAVTVARISLTFVVYGSVSTAASRWQNKS